MADVFDAFTEGVSLDGLRTKNDIRVLICYMLSSLAEPISKSGLNEAILSAQLANFFEINEAIGDLCESGLISSQKRNGEDYLLLNEQGYETAKQLETVIRIDVRDKAVKAAIRLLSRERIKSCADYTVKKLENGCMVTLKIFDGDLVMMETSLYTTDSIQAHSIGEDFMEDPTKLYSVIVDTIAH